MRYRGQFASYFDQLFFGYFPIAPPPSFQRCKGTKLREIGFFIDWQNVLYNLGYMLVSAMCCGNHELFLVVISYYLTATIHSINTSLTLQCFTHTLAGNLPLTYLKQHLRRGFAGVYRGEELSICNFTPPPKPCPTNRSNSVIPRIPLECLLLLFPVLK